MYQALFKEMQGVNETREKSLVVRKTLAAESNQGMTYESLLDGINTILESDIPPEIEDAIKVEVSQLNLKNSLAELQRLDKILGTPDAMTADGYAVDAAKHYFLKSHIRRLEAEAKDAGKPISPKIDLVGLKMTRGLSDYGVMKNSSDYTKKKMPQDLIYAIGNLKLGEDTLIFNMGSATNCPSRKLGLCKVCTGGGKCYALKAELFHSDDIRSAQRSRDLQGKQWEKFSVEKLAQQMLDVIEKQGIRFVRLNEAGDFRSQADVDKASMLADSLKGKAVVYLYTARSDLNFSNISSNLVVNGSGHMVDNQFTFVARENIKDIPKGSNICGGDCRVCDWCKVKRGMEVLIEEH